MGIEIPRVRFEAVDNENADFDLTSVQTVLTHTLTEDGLYVARLQIGDGVKDLDASGGGFELTIVIDGNTVEPGPQTITFGTNARSSAISATFVGKVGEQVLLKLKSPNAGDTDVDVTADLFALV